MQEYKLLAQTNLNTVVTNYEKVKQNRTTYQSEADLENEFIKMLVEQGYEHLKDVHNEEGLIKNLRVQLEKLNNYKFTDEDWRKFFNDSVANPAEQVQDKLKKIQKDYTQNLTRDNAPNININLIDKHNPLNNNLQVINQYEVDYGTGKNRYDVTILVNGLPLVHIELKRRGSPESLKDAFNQIQRYKKNSFSAGKKLYEYVQIFVISNGTNTKYFSSSTNKMKFAALWSDEQNKIINDLVDFTKTFFARHTLLNILTKYCVFTTENILMVMRPYQIVAVEKIMHKILRAENNNKYGTIEAGVYIWHTTGSGKTLTSFKAAQLASNLKHVDKVLFVVDRKDLDYQTMKEYDKYEKGAANSTNSAKILEEQLNKEETNAIIITTIQKLAVFIKNNPNHAIYDKKIIIIFDECHRSQFGDMHRAIKKHFKKYCMFGFTGTPILKENADKAYQTTEQLFGDRLHTYTIVNAIQDKNVLPFMIDYVNTFKGSRKY